VQARWQTVCFIDILLLLLRLGQVSHPNHPRVEGLCYTCSDPSAIIEVAASGCVCSTGICSQAPLNDLDDVSNAPLPDGGVGTDSDDDFDDSASYVSVDSVESVESVESVDSVSSDDEDE